MTFTQLGAVAALLLTACAHGGAVSRWTDEPSVRSAAPHPTTIVVNGVHVITVQDQDFEREDGTTLLRYAEPSGAFAVAIASPDVPLILFSTEAEVTRRWHGLKVPLPALADEPCAVRRLDSPNIPARVALDHALVSVEIRRCR